MSVSHHGDNQRDSEVMKRFLDQINGQAKRAYPKGRMGHEDDGALSYAVACDRVRNTIIIRFGKPVEWIGLGRDDVEQLISKLQEMLAELQVGQEPNHERKI